MKYVVGNWKMNMDLRDVNSWLDKFLARGVTSEIDSEIIIAPSHLHLETAYNRVKNTDIQISAQDTSESTRGAHTGNVGAFQLKDLCKYCIVGHSERKETAETVFKKADLCIQHNITPIVCFIEAERLKQYVPFEELALFAWENPDNISKNGEYNPKDPDKIADGLRDIRKHLKKDSVVIYGGSVTGQNASELAKIPGLNGVLAGNASTDPEHFFDIIVKYCEK